MYLEQINSLRLVKNVTSNNVRRLCIQSRLQNIVCFFFLLKIGLALLFIVA